MKKPKSKTVMNGSLMVISNVDTARSVAQRDVREMQPKQLAEYHRKEAVRLLDELSVELSCYEDFDPLFSHREALKVADLAERAAMRMALIRNLVREVSP